MYNHIMKRNIAREITILNVITTVVELYAVVTAPKYLWQLRINTFPEAAKCASKNEVNF